MSDRAYKRGVRKLEHALGYLKITIQYLTDARQFPIYTDTGEVASSLEIKQLSEMRDELAARIDNLGGNSDF